MQWIAATEKMNARTAVAPEVGEIAFDQSLADSHATKLTVNVHVQMSWIKSARCPSEFSVKNSVPRFFVFPTPARQSRERQAFGETNRAQFESIKDFFIGLDPHFGK